MIKKILIAILFPLSLNAQKTNTDTVRVDTSKSDTLAIGDDERLVRLMDAREVLESIEDKVTVKEFKVISAVIDALFRRSLHDFKPNKK